MIKRLIFDVDKTLIGETDFTDTVRKVLSKYGICNPNNIEGFKRAMTDYELTHDYYSKCEYLDYINSKIDTRMYIDFLFDYFEELRYAVPDPIMGVNESLNKLKEFGFEMVCLTNFFANPQRKRLETLDLSKYIDRIYGEYISKPATASYLMAAGDNNPSECVMIGDNLLLDVMVPANLGFNTIYVTGQNYRITSEYNEVKSVADITPKFIKELK